MTEEVLQIRFFRIFFLVTSLSISIVDAGNRVQMETSTFTFFSLQHEMRRSNVPDLARRRDHHREYIAAEPWKVAASPSSQ